MTKSGEKYCRYNFCLFRGIRIEKIKAFKFSYAPMFHCRAQTKNSFRNSGATLSNSLLRDIREAESLGLFKRIKEVRWGTAFVESNFS